MASILLLSVPMIPVWVFVAAVSLPIASVAVWPNAFSVAAPVALIWPSAAFRPLVRPLESTSV